MVCKGGRTHSDSLQFHMVRQRQRGGQCDEEAAIVRGGRKGQYHALYMTTRRVGVKMARARNVVREQHWQRWEVDFGSEADGTHHRRGKNRARSLGGAERETPHARKDGEGVTEEGISVWQGIEEGGRWVRRAVRTTPSTRGYSEGRWAGRRKRRGKDGREDGGRGMEDHSLHTRA